LQWQHDAAEPHVALPHWLPGSFWQVPLTTHVYVAGHVPHDPPQPSSPHAIDPQNGKHAASPPCVAESCAFESATLESDALASLAVEESPAPPASELAPGESAALLASLAPPPPSSPASPSVDEELPLHAANAASSGIAVRMELARMRSFSSTQGLRGSFRANLRTMRVMARQGFPLVASMLLTACAGTGAATPVSAPVGAPVAAPGSSPAPATAAARSKELEKLAEARVELAKKRIALLQAKFEHGAASLSELLEARRDVAFAARDSGMRGEALMRVLADYRDAMRSLIELTKTRHAQGAVDEASVQAAEAALAEADFWLAEASEREGLASPFH
jgi:hypothetical protein